MKHLYILFCACALLFPMTASAQIQFRKATDLLSPAKHFSGVPIAIIDMDGDGHDDIARMSQATHLAIEYQTAPNRAFRHRDIGQMDFEPQWGMCAADINNDGFSDVLTAGYYDGIKVAFSLDTAYLIDELSGPATFAQCVNFADINNDGWLDAFVCHDEAESRIFGNDGTGKFEYRPEWINLSTVPASDNSGNYGSVWSDIDNDGDLDLYIAKCRQDVNDPTDPTRINQLFLNNGDGTYTQDTLDAAHLRIGAQSWTADFGDMDNDGDFDCFLTNHDVSSQLLENDGAGHFTDISVEAGLFDQVTGLPIQGLFRDFDNDGYLDILVSGALHHLFRNNGNKTFTGVKGLFDKKQIQSLAVGDLNSDGFWDIYAGYAVLFNEPSKTVPDVLWLNEGNNNHFVGLNLKGVQSNRSAVGAKVKLYTAAGLQVREVRAGESYGISNSMHVHFGTGALTNVDSVVVRWPSGAVDKLMAPTVDQYYTLVEKTCALNVQIEPTGSTTFCSGDSVRLNAPAGFLQYKWSNGATTQSIVVHAQGDFSVQATTGPNCAAWSNIIGVVVNPVQIPVITPETATEFCEGDKVTLTASPALAYFWNTGENTPSITVQSTGTYLVTTQGLCEQFTSNTLPVTVFDAPVPVLTGDTVLVNETATLTAQGLDPRWYDVPTGGTPFFTGNQFMTPLLSVSDTFWVEDIKIHDAPDEPTGMPSHQGTSFGDVNYNGAIIFDCFKPFRLAQVRVQTNTAGDRKIILRDAARNVLQSKTINIGSGIATIDLDFDIPVGFDLSLTTDSLVNQQSFGTEGPRLRRSDQGVKYPYEIPGVVSLNNSSFDASRYYYFYNWVVDYYSYDCVSERLPVVAFIKPTSATKPEPGFAGSLRLFPNPTSGLLTAEIGSFSGGSMLVSVKNAQGSTLQMRSLQLPVGKTSFHTDFGGFAKGIYWLEMTTAQGVVQRKITVH